MHDLHAFVRREIAPLGLPSGHEDKIVAEWAAQLADQLNGLQADGMSPEAAWDELQRQLPDWNALRHDLLEGERLFDRAERRPLHVGPASAASRLETARGLIAGAVRDLRAAARLLRRDAGFTGTIVLTLAVCLGANAAIFAVVNAVLLRPLPIPEADRIVGMGDVYPTVTPNDILANDAPSYFDRRQALTTLEEQAMFTYWYDTLPVDGMPQELRGMRATPSLFRLLRVAPAIGRAFTDQEGESTAERPIILSHGLWQTLFAGRADAIGRTLRLGWTGEPHTVVGVMPPGFSFFDAGPDGHAGQAAGVQFWIPLVFTPEQKTDAARTRYGFFHVGRLQPGATVAQLQHELDAIRARNGERFPQFRLDELGMYTLATPLQEALTRGVSRTLYLLWAGAGLVLLIGTINIANLSLARANARRRELATRLALGASRFYGARQLLVEALLPATLGGVAGLGVAVVLLRALAASGVSDLPNAADVQIDPTTILFVAAATAAVALLIGLAPAVTAGGVTVGAALGDGSRGASSGRGSRLFRRGLVVAQVALSVVLLIAATLLLTSFRHLLDVDGGFAADGVVTGTVFPPPSRYPTPAHLVALQDRIAERVRVIPGVAAAGLTSNIALSGFESPSTVSAVDRRDDQPLLVPSVIAATPGYFEAMTTPLLRGRAFSDADRAGAPRVAIVDERLASLLWPGAEPLGRSIMRGDVGPFTVVGVARDVRFETLAASVNASGTAYFPHAQTPPLGRLRWLAVRSSVDPAAVTRAVRAAIAEIDPDLPLADIQTMSQRTAKSLLPQRLATSLAGLFAGVALFLSILGIYGVLAHLVARRTREIGIRMALGSSISGIYTLVLKEGLLLIGGGLLLGIGGALAAAGALQGLLFGVRSTDPLYLTVVALGTGGVALLACIAPARRAAHVDPVRVLSEP